MSNLPKILDKHEPTELEKLEDNKLHIDFLVAVKEISQRADKNDPESLRRCSEEYLQLCAVLGKPITNMAWYQALGISKQTAEMWRNGGRRASDPRYRQLIEDIDGFCAMNREQLMAEGRLQVATGIWWQKNYDKMTDYPQAPDNNAVEKEVRSPQQIAEKYKYLLDK